MVISDHQLKIRYFSSRFCGSSHDSRVFMQSFLRALLLQRFDVHRPLALLGDEGYACEDVLLTPFRQKTVEREADLVQKQKMIDYNKAHRSVRVGIEHTFGILKKRFPGE